MEVVDVAVQSGHLKLLPLAGRQGIYLFFSSCFFYKDEVPELLLHPIEAGGFIIHLILEKKINSFNYICSKL